MGKLNPITGPPELWFSHGSLTGGVMVPSFPGEQRNSEQGLKGGWSH